MRTSLLALFAGGTVLYLAYWFKGCTHRWTIKHRPDPVQHPLKLEWICWDCGKVLGTTDATPVRQNVTPIVTRRQHLKQVVGGDAVRRRA